MIRDLVKDDAILSQRCEKATAEDAALVDDLVDTLNSLEEGVCLAANQIGVTKAVVVYMDDDKTPHALFNPRILLGLRPFPATEGCLSREDVAKVRRFQKIKVAFDELVDGQLKPRKRDFTGWTAQMVQHMVDHCNGKLV
ncbi:MAG: peptide deformylase [Coriobacteriales bacterium]|nr:peptide deformylase [Coriobacteriales bacterium]